MLASFLPEPPILEEFVAALQRAEGIWKNENASLLSPRFEYQGHEVYTAGDTALHITPWIMFATAPDGTKLEQRGFSVAVMRRMPPPHRLLHRSRTTLRVSDSPVLARKKDKLLDQS